MRWKVTLVAEVESGQSIAHDIASLHRDERITPATLGLSIAEGKAVLAAIQAQLVGDQVQRHGEVARHCLWCGRAQSSKGHYRSTFRSVFGKIPMRVRRFHACPCRTDGPKTVPALFTRRSPVAPELRYLTAKLAALMPFGNDDTPITVLSDGDAGLRAIQRAAAPEAEPVLDWFHIAMRWQHVHQLATGAIRQGQTAEARTWLLDLIERAKWAL
ncbi:MAG: hypothetical protein ABJA98_06955 [Acidobacteriota bacterium]